MSESRTDGMLVKLGLGGPPLHFSVGRLGNDIGRISSNTNAVSILDVPFAAPDAETLRLAYDMLVLGLRW